MSKKAYDDQTVTQYLLGSLPEEEAERLDELSFTDEEFAGALFAAEKDLVDAYARGELSGTALKQFESHYLATPLRRGRVEFAGALRDFAAKGAAALTPEASAGAAVEPATRRKGSARFPLLSVFAPPRTAWRWGFAVAALVLLAACVWLGVENVRLRGEIAQTRGRGGAASQREQELQGQLDAQREARAATEQELAQLRDEHTRLEQELQGREARQEEQASNEQRAAESQKPQQQNRLGVASFVLTPQLRGAGRPPAVPVPSGTAYAAARLELEPNAYAAFRVSLLDSPGGRTLWRSGELRTRAQGDTKTLAVRFDAGLLRQGSYVLRVTGVAPEGASETVGDYPFRVVKQ